MKKTRFIFIFICCLSEGSVSSQISRKPAASVYTGIGVYSLNHIDAFSFISNQASLAQVKEVAIGVFGEKRFLLNELSNYNAVAVLKTSSGNFGLKSLYYGSESYSETQLGLAYGRKLGNKLDLGAQFNYNGINISGYGSSGIISFEIGTIFHVTDQVHAGFHINNPAGAKFGKDHQEKLASVYTFGLGYDVSEIFLISTEIVKEEDQDVTVNAGVQYRLIPQLHTRAGISAANGMAWIGIGYKFKNFRVDLSSSHHPKLGLSPGLMILFNFNRKEN